MEDPVQVVTGQFPARRADISDLASRDQDFLEICKDYADAKAELAKWEISADPRRKERLVEYAELVEDLAREIENALKLALTSPPHRQNSPGNR